MHEIAFAYSKGGAMGHIVFYIWTMLILLAWIAISVVLATVDFHDTYLHDLYFTALAELVVAVASFILWVIPAIVIHPFDPFDFVSYLGKIFSKYPKPISICWVAFTVICYALLLLGAGVMNFDGNNNFQYIKAGIKVFFSYWAAAAFVPVAVYVAILWLKTKLSAPSQPVAET